MEIQKVDLKFIQKAGFTAQPHCGIQHIKTLPFLSVVQATEGSYGIQLAEGQLYNTGEGGFFVAPSAVQQSITHYDDPTTGRMTARWVFLSVKVNEVYDFDRLFDFPVTIPSPQKEEMNRLFDRLFATDDPFEENICCYEIVRLLFQLSAEKRHKMPLHIEKALTYLREHYMEKITIQDIATEVNLSPSHLFSVFKAEMGVSPIAFLNNYRLSIATDALLRTDKTISEIADAVGISDSVYFNKQFRKAYQLSPSAYRKSYKNGSE